MVISVIIPTYNRAALTVETLENILAQVRRPDEIVVVDDGSSDNTGEALAPYSDRIHYIYKENGGLAAARQTGYEAATGDALLFIDSDDLLVPEALQVLEQRLEANPEAPLAFCRAQLIDENGKVISPLWDIDDDPVDYWHHLIKGNFIRSSGAVLIRRIALERAGDWNLNCKGSEDWEMWLRLAETGLPFVRVPEPLFLYRVHSSNMSGNQELMRHMGLRVLEMHIQRHENDPERRKAVYRQYAICMGIPLTEEYAAEKGIPPPDPDIQPVAPAPMKQQHRLLRTMIEKTGVAGLYRKVPETYRRRFRVVFGIDPNA